MNQRWFKQVILAVISVCGLCLLLIQSGILGAGIASTIVKGVLSLSLLLLLVLPIVFVAYGFRRSS